MSSLIWIEEADVVLVSGEQATVYLNGQISAGIESLVLGQAQRSLLLGPDGTLVAPLGVRRLGENDYALFSPFGTGVEVVKRLERFRLRTKVGFASSPGCIVHLCGGSEAETAELSHLVDNKIDGSGSSPQRQVGEVFLRQHYFTVGCNEIAGFLTDVEFFDHSATARILAGEPAWGFEIIAGMNPMELGEHYIRSSADFEKGCYTGQELIARVDARGYKTPRRLSNFLIRFSDKESTTMDSLEFAVDGKPAFTLTSYRYYDPGNCGIALGFVHRLGGEYFAKVSTGLCDVHSVELGNLEKALASVEW